jgi:hypothetical protein
MISGSLLRSFDIPKNTTEHLGGIRARPASPRWFAPWYVCRPPEGSFLAALSSPAMLIMIAAMLIMSSIMHDVHEIYLDDHHITQDLRL